MGITIFYRGKLRAIADLPEIVRSVEAKARQFGWRCQMIDERILGIGERHNWKTSKRTMVSQRVWLA